MLWVDFKIRDSKCVLFIKMFYIVRKFLVFESYFSIVGLIFVILVYFYLVFSMVSCLFFLVLFF